ncbi:MAG: hypothetical protein LBP75_00445 [Planctomycetota bacterium]|nr:hypothetical protein [Planctomycetota bacterium]
MPLSTACAKTPSASRILLGRLQFARVAQADNQPEIILADLQERRRRCWRTRQATPNSHPATPLST